MQPLILRLLVLLCASYFLWQQWQLLLPLQTRHYISEIQLGLKPGEERILGQKELGAPAAEERHIRIDRDTVGNWRLTNIAVNRAVDITDHKGVTKRLRHWPLAKGMEFRILQTRYEVLEAGPNNLKLQTQDGKFWQYDGYQLAADIDKTQAACPDLSWQARWLGNLHSTWNSVLPAVLTIHQPLSIGGNAPCGPRLTQKDIPDDAARIHWQRKGQHWVLHAQELPSTHLCMLPCADGEGLHTQTAPLEQINSITIGRTSYKLTVANETLILHAKSRSAWVEAPPPQQSHNIIIKTAHPKIWVWDSPSSPLLTLALALLFCALTAAYIQRALGTRLKHADNALLLSAGVAGATLGLLFHLSDIGIGWGLVLLTLSTAGVVLLVPAHGIAGIAWGSAIILLLWGLAAQAQLGVSMNDTGDLRFYRNGLGIGTFVLSIILCKQGWPHPLSDDAREKAVVFLAITAFIALIAQACFGSEAGLWGIQPLEIGFIALVLLTAQAGTRIMALSNSHLASKGFPFNTVLLSALLVTLFMAFMAISLLIVKDFSPLALLVGFGIGILLALSHANKLIALVTLSLAAIFIALISWAYLYGFEHAHNLGLYIDRLEVWQHPEQHPHSGAQLQQAWSLILSGHAPGGASLNPWRVPAIQNDFMPSAFIALNKAPTAMLLVSLQMLMITAVLASASQLLTRIPNDNAEQRNYRHFLFFALWGLGFVLLGHIVISWGTNLGFLPVMGQPMPFLSAGGSLLVFVLLPLYLLLQSMEEISIPRQ